MLGGDTFLLNQRNRNYVEGRATRPVSTASVPGCMLVFMVPFLLAGMFTLALAIKSWSDLVGYAVAGRPATGMVVSKGITRDSEGDDDPYLTYSYSAAEEDGGGRYTGRANVSWAVYEAFGPEDPLALEYIAYSPGTSRLAGGHGALGDVAFITFFTLFWNVITLGMTYFLVTARLKGSRLKREGVLVRGTLTDYTTSTDSDHDLWVKLAYSFHTPTGQLVTGEDHRVRNELKGKAAPPIGTPVAVLYVDAQTHTLL